MNIYLKILNKTLANQIRALSVINYDCMEFITGMQGWFNTNQCV